MADVPITPLTRPPKHHFFGRYGVPPRDGGTWRTIKWRSWRRVAIAAHSVKGGGDRGALFWRGQTTLEGPCVPVSRGDPRMPIAHVA